MSSQLLRRVVAAILLALALGFGYWYLGVWSVSKAFQQTHLDGLSNILQAGAGKVLADPNGIKWSSDNNEPSKGILDWYQKHPGDMEKDQELFKTWLAALTVASSGLDHGSSNWHSTESIAWLKNTDRVDAWSHPFCVKTGRDVSIVVSAGPEGLAALDCSHIILSDSDLNRFVSARLNVDASGALILFVRRKVTNQGG
ncbi:MAG TPA: hypothetical protein VKH81_08430 [Candidatus Angelobacter sp.]|nr:hypothetical protein [Candidatus Angelobacter sp.]